MGNGGGDPKKLKAKVDALQLTTAGLLQLLGGSEEDRNRFWEKMKGITTRLHVQMVDQQLDLMQALVNQVQTSAKALEKTAKQIAAGG